MEGIAGDDPGPHTLKTDASAAQNEESLRWLTARFTGYVGIENYLGAKFTADADAVSPTLAEIARRGLLYLDDGSSPVSKVGDLAAGLDLKAARADASPSATLARSTPRSGRPRTSPDAAAPRFRRQRPARDPRPARAVDAGA